MVLVKIMKRKDASSLVVAIAVGMALGQFMASVAFPLTYKLIPMNAEFSGGIGGGWKQEYLNPLVTFLIQLILLEVVVRVAVVIRELVVKNRPR